MRKHELGLQDPLPSLVLYRQHDRHLMNRFINEGYTGKHLALLKVCREALRVNTLSEITTADGKYLEQWALKGRPQDVTNKYQWPRQPTPKKAHWVAWESALIHCFADLYSTEKKLRRPLGPWTGAAKKDWNWFYSEAEQRVYHYENLGWRGYSRISRRSQRVRLQKFIKRDDILEEDLPEDARIATIERSQIQDLVRLTGIGEVDDDTQPDAEEHPTTIVDALLQQPEADQWAVESLDCTDNGMSMAEAIIRGTARSVSDGSFKDEIGTSAFTVHAEGMMSITGVNAVPGNAQDQSAYRSELAGVSGTLALAASVCKVHDIVSECITIGLDGEQALKAAGGEWRLNPAQPDFDLLTDIRKKVHRLPIQVKWKWIRGHQDDDKTYDELDDWAQANVRMDELAKAYWKHLKQKNYQPQPQRFGDEDWSITFRGEKLSRLHIPALYSAMCRDSTFDYWAGRAHIPRDTIDACDWEACGKAFKSISLSKQRRVTKHASGHMACGKMMAIWKLVVMKLQKTQFIH